VDESKGLNRTEGGKGKNAKKKFKEKGKGEGRVGET